MSEISSNPFTPNAPEEITPNMVDDFAHHIMAEFPDVIPKVHEALAPWEAGQLNDAKAIESLSDVAADGFAGYLETLLSRTPQR